ncbi:glutamyl-tRNA reductase [uncultured Clostridium sp.]|uniref:glutamyl-tRNA reductase n=1 Tax=uncultured Clostridium sp. TaxID=59620 RepID=UPI0025D5AAA0|nr:glutamyl-tRNA reductase [uncultured Clostridium sp.]
MIGLIGIKKNTPLEIREKLVLKPKKCRIFTEKLLEIFKEVVILSTCNRTEIYFNDFFEKEELLKEIFDILEWNYSLREYVFLANEEESCRHLFEVCCGFHSKITGEDQILGQIKNAYEEACKYNSVNMELHRLFQEAVTCGKRFKNEARLYDIPVSSASIAVNESIKKGCLKFMLIGYGDVGHLVMKYLLSHKSKCVYLVVRNINIKNEIQDERVKVITFEEKDRYIDEVDCIISCTSAPHIVISHNDIKKSGRKLYIYDLAVPRDVDKEIENIDRAEVYNIDKISVLNDENKKLRIERMNENRYILNKYLTEFNEWKKVRKVIPEIKRLKEVGNDVYEKRSITFKNKCKDKKDAELAEVLIKSASDFYVNRAIKVLKEETLKGCESKCIEILEKIFKVK